METAPIPAPPPPSFTGRFFRFLRARPILVLLFFSPGLIEYLSGSSPLALVALNPTFFVFQLLINVGLYGPGVLLIREAMIRWMKGWATVLLLGVAYGILEEGVALSTMFNSLSGPAASAGLGTYGHFVGVDWVWALQISIVHALFSISIPIMLLGLALPETRGRSLLTGRGIMLALGVWGVEIPLLILLVRQWSGFFAGLPLILGSLGVIAILVLAARAAPKDIIVPKTTLPNARTVVFFAVGLAFPLAVTLGADLPRAIGLPPLFAMGVMLGVGALWLWWVLRNIGTEHNETALLALVGGLYTIIMFGGVQSQIGLPIILAGDAAFVLFLLNLWRRCSRDSNPFPHESLPAHLSASYPGFDRNAREKEMGGRQRKYNYLGAGLRGVGPIGIYQIGSLDYLVERPQTRTDGLSQIEFTKSVDIDHRLP